VRHALMLPNLNPMFMLEFTGRGVKSLRFVTPDEDVTLEFHCHVETHEDMGMHGQLIVGKGGTPTPAKAAVGPKRVFEGKGVVVSIDARDGRLIVDHEEIKDFMAPMVMSYQVLPGTLLKGLKPGSRIRFTIDADKRAIVGIKPLAQ